MPPSTSTSSTGCAAPSTSRRPRRGRLKRSGDRRTDSHATAERSRTHVRQRRAQRRGTFRQGNVRMSRLYRRRRQGDHAQKGGHQPENVRSRRRGTTSLGQVQCRPFHAPAGLLSRSCKGLCGTERRPGRVAGNRLSSIGAGYRFGGRPQAATDAIWRVTGRHLVRIVSHDPVHAQRVESAPSPRGRRQAVDRRGAEGYARSASRRACYPSALFIIVFWTETGCETP